MSPLCPGVLTRPPHIRMGPTAALGPEPPRGAGVPWGIPSSCTPSLGGAEGCSGGTGGDLLPDCPQTPNCRILPQAGEEPTRLPLARGLAWLVPPLALVGSEMGGAAATRGGQAWGQGWRSWGPLVSSPHPRARCSQHHPMSLAQRVTSSPRGDVAVPSHSLAGHRPRPHRLTPQLLAPRQPPPAPLKLCHKLRQRQRVGVPCPQTAWCHRVLMRARGRWARGCSHALTAH